MGIPKVGERGECELACPQSQPLVQDAPGRVGGGERRFQPLGGPAAPWMRGRSSRGVGRVKVRVKVRLLNSLELVLEKIPMSGERKCLTLESWGLSLDLNLIPYQPQSSPHSLHLESYFFIFWITLHAFNGRKDLHK